MDARELAEWRAFDLLEPVGERVTHRMLAHLIAVVMNRTAAKGEKLVTVEELLPRYVEKTEEAAAPMENWQRLKQQMMVITRKADARGKNEKREGA